MKRTLPFIVRHAIPTTAAIENIAAVVFGIYRRCLQKIKKIIFIFCSLAVIIPMTASAASKINTILTNIQDTLGIVIKILITLALVVFIGGVVRFIFAAGNPQAITRAKGVMYYGIIAIAVLATLTGIVAFLQTYFGITGGQPIIIPQF